MAPRGVELHPAVSDRLARLAPDQRAAATAPPGPVLCVAPAGSGKTTTLVARICWLVATGTDPEAITALTFNRRAADELGERLEAALQPLDVRTLPRVRTFHALGREILADAGIAVGNLVDRADVLRRLSTDTRLPDAALRRYDDAFSRLKLDEQASAAGVRVVLAQRRAQGGDDEEAVLQAFVAYEEWLAANGALDFDDLVLRALATLRADDGLLARWRGRCASLLVDEVQDVDRTQLDLALALLGEARDIFLVGDDDQTIYAWRLADVRRVLNLAAALPGLARVDLVTNYRCPRPVVERAVRLISVNDERFVKRIVAGPNAAGRLYLLPEPGDDTARARRLLTEWLPRDAGEHAVLARTNAELAVFAALALELGIAYRAADDGLLLDDPALDDLLDALDRAGTTPPAAWLARLHRPPAVARALLGWSIGHRSAEALRRAIEAARTRRAELRRDDAELVLATAHGTKGLEFDHVACIGLDDGVFPSRRTLDEAADGHRALEEERRLAYVAWTRAKKSLVLVYDPQAPSVFMREAFDERELGLIAAG